VTRKTAGIGGLLVEGNDIRIDRGAGGKPAKGHQHCR
jgi:hypothetical protein